MSAYQLRAFQKYRVLLPFCVIITMMAIISVVPGNFDVPFERLSITKGALPIASTASDSPVMEEDHVLVHTYKTKIEKNNSQKILRINTASDKVVDDNKNQQSWTVQTGNGNDEKEVRHLAFLKVHKAASSTIQNIVFRFGLQRNLSFVIPQDNHYLSKTKYVYNRILKPIDTKGSPQGPKNSSGKCDIICNHAVFNHDFFSQLLHDDTIYFSIIRDPFDLFLSSAYYYRDVWHIPYLAKLDNKTFITDLIREPEVNEHERLSVSRTYNTMARDFGFIVDSFEAEHNITDEMFQVYLQEIADIFPLVMIVERFQESLIMLKRLLHWSFRDILYVKNNVHKRDTTLYFGEDDLDAFRRRQRFDYKLYAFFYDKFEDRVLREAQLAEEVKAFNDVQKAVEDFCLDNSGRNTHIDIDKNEWTHGFSVKRKDCQLMLLGEIKFFRQMKDRHKQMLGGGGDDSTIT